ncbi:MarR family transcriptional regulator [Actinomadura barringtoniae]|uniref:MarR family transcriptional regulator n=1 Tax=Actinomadura barringtoniae TaxID=1427535 RepID=A0A939PGC2_9ACTN|nr:helix-turn-helix domain-containing protein [Actinomadura barringtoniae]MBO2452145.1 MarR family transcriptional regulator [Actinomadura barringtoniae]
MESDDGKPWTFLTNHARVLISIARDPEIRMRDIAEEIGITERAAQLIIADLEEAKYLTRTRIGRRNTYEIDLGRPFRHPAEAGSDLDIEVLIDLFVDHDHRHRAPTVTGVDDGSQTPAAAGPMDEDAD